MNFFAYMLTFQILANAYIFWRFSAAFGRGWWQIVLFLWMLTVVLGPAFIRMAGRDYFYETLGLINGLWFALTAILCTWMGLADLLRLVLWVAGKVMGNNPLGWMPLSRSVLLTVGLTLCLALYAVYEAYNPRVVVRTIKTDKLPEDVHKLRIVFFSDLHLNNLVGERTLARILAPMHQQKPDLLLLGGDIVDGNMENSKVEAILLRNLKPRLGSYAVFGNHEGYAGIRNSLDFFKTAGVRVLRDEAMEIGPITIAGVDDPRLRTKFQEDPVDTLKVLEPLDQSRFTILLSHRPPMDDSAAGLCDLILSGHTHGGQIWPAGLLLRGLLKRPQGFSIMTSPKGRSTLFISNGVAFWRIPMRLFTPPDFLVLDLVRE